MSNAALLIFAGAFFSTLLALAVLLRRHRSPANWFFFAGVICLAVESIFAGYSVEASTPERMVYWQRLALAAKAMLPGLWLCFSLSYSRGNYREFLTRWRHILTAAFLLPVILITAFPQRLLHLVPAARPGEATGIAFGTAGTVLNVLFLTAIVIVLMNLEKTFRTAVGTMRWRIKFVVLGLCVIFGAKIYTSSQMLLYSKVNLSLSSVSAGALLIGCAFIGLAYVRSGLAEVDVYPSHTFLYNSITVVLSGVYLLIIGLVARIVAFVGASTSFPVEAFLLLIGLVGLAVVLLSDRIRQKTKRFVSRHFARPLYDYQKVWNLFTEKTAHAGNQASLCSQTAKLISDTFNVLSVTVWLVNEKENLLTFGASTSLPAGGAAEPRDVAWDPAPIAAALRAAPYPFDLETSGGPWAAKLRQLNPGMFRTGGDRICVPVVAGEQSLGVIILADRVSGIPFSLEELDLLRCIGNQLGANLLGIRLSQELMVAREQDAFRAVSTFFAHDLKNAASSLSLMVQNFPRHFEDPEFRTDVLRGLEKTVKHMNHLISRLSVFREKPALRVVSSDLNELVSGALSRWETPPGIGLSKELGPLPQAALDPEQIQNVIINLLLNARDAIGQRGQIRIHTSQRNGWAVLTVADDGCGMSPEFIRESLFRPFQTTKKEGTGIGLFQCKTIIEAHRGKIEVESERGKGTAFHLLLPLTPQN